MIQSDTLEKSTISESGFNPLIEQAKEAPDVLLDNLGGIALGVVFPELALDVTDDLPPVARTFSANGSNIETTLPQLSYHVAMPEGIVITPSTRAVYIPIGAKSDIVNILMTAPARDLQTSLSERANDIAQPFTLTPKYGMARTPGKALVTPRNDPSKSYLESDLNWIPTVTTGTRAEFSLLTPLAEPDPADAVMEKDSQIRATSPKEDAPKIMDEPRHTLAQTYYYELRRALGVNYGEQNVGKKFLEDFRPILVSPTLVVLVDRRTLEDQDASPLIVLANGHNDAGDHWWHRQNFNPTKDDGDAINNWLHGLERKKQYNGPHIEPLK